MGASASYLNQIYHVCHEPRQISPWIVRPESIANPRAKRFGPFFTFRSAYILCSKLRALKMITPKVVQDIIRTLKNAGHQAFVVGGSVRDQALGLTPKDWDMATSATPNQVTELFSKVLPTGIDFGTVTVMVDGEGFEVTTFRADGHSSDGRHPDEVQFSESIQEDLARRDFSCNAVAFDPITDDVIDPFGGLGDITAKIVRAVGDPKTRFREDGLRLLRAVRFCATKGFALDAETAEAIPQCLDMLDGVSKERIQAELLKIISGPKAGWALDFMQTSGLMSKVCPELTKQVGLSQNHHHEWEVWEHTKRCVVAERTGRPLLRLAVLLHDIAKPATRNPHPDRPGEFQFLKHETLGAEMAEKWMREFKFSNEDIELVTHTIKHHLIFFTVDWSDKQLRRWLRKVGPKHLDELLEVRRADIVGKRTDVRKELIEQDLLKLRIETVSQDVPHTMAHLALRGGDVIKIRDLKKGGPIVGKIMKHLLDVVTDDPELNTVEALSPIAEGFQDGV